MIILNSYEKVIISTNQRIIHLITWFFGGLIYLTYLFLRNDVPLFLKSSYMKVDNRIKFRLFNLNEYYFLKHLTKKCLMENKETISCNDLKTLINNSNFNKYSETSNHDINNTSSSAFPDVFLLKFANNGIINMKRLKFLLKSLKSCKISIISNKFKPEIVQIVNLNQFNIALENFFK